MWGLISADQGKDLGSEKAFYGKILDKSCLEMDTSADLAQQPRIYYI